MATATGNNNGTGADGLAFRSTGTNSPNELLSDHFGDQSLAVLGDSNQMFDTRSGGNFIAG